MKRAQNDATTRELQRELEALDSKLTELSKQTARKTSFFDPTDHSIFRNLERGNAISAELPQHVQDVLDAANRARARIEDAFELMPHKDEAARAEVFSRLLDAKAYIEENFAKEIDLEAMAKQAAISSFYFVRLFKRAFGYSPYQYLIRYRLDRAADLLLTTELPVYEIGMKCGFDSHIVFSAQFKQHIGQPPSRYRMMGGRGV